MATVLALGTVVLWPVFLTSTWRAEPDGRLTFGHVGGTGTLACRRCGHSEQVVGFLHGIGDDWRVTGLQCQSCGRLGSVEHFHGRDTFKNRCDCINEPTRDDPLFCPRCRSYDLGYSMISIT